MLKKLRDIHLIHYGICDFFMHRCTLVLVETPREVLAIQRHYFARYKSYTAATLTVSMITKKSREDINSPK